MDIVASRQSGVKGHLGARGEKWQSVPDGIASAPAVMSRKFAQWLSKQAEIHGWGQGKDIAKKTGLSTAYVSRVLAGKRRGDVGIDKLQQVAQALGVETWRLVWMIENGVSEIPNPSPPRSRRH